MNLEKKVLDASTQCEIDNILIEAKLAHKRAFIYFNISTVLLLFSVFIYIDNIIGSISLSILLLIWIVTNGVLISNLQPVWLAEPISSDLCKEAVTFVNNSTAANIYRNEVVAKGIQFTHSHYKMIRSIYEAEQNNQPCKELHLIN